jgi:hypothetical protein
VRHQGYLQPAESKRLSEHCAANHVSESAVIREALSRYFEAGADDTTLIMQRVDRVLRAQARTQRDLELLSEAFALFVKFWFAHTPAVSAAERPAARTSAEARYAQFVEYVSQQFSAGRRFLEDLPRETLADEQELAALARSSGAPGGRTDA